MLKKNHTLTVPLRMIWVDTEALNDEGKPAAGRQRLFFGVAKYEAYRNGNAINPFQSESLRFETAGEFWEWVIGRTLEGRSTWVLAHNWNYDGGILSTSTELEARGWKSVKYINGKPPLIVRWRKHGATILMVDTLNYFTTSVASLGEAVELPKLDMPKGDDEKEWGEYAWRDVEIIRRAFLAFRDFVRSNDLGVMQPTLASQAFTSYRHRFMPHAILVHDDFDALALERESYHGGRTEALYRGKVTEKLYKLDINSMYPAIMRNQRLGHWFLGYFPSFKSSWWQEALNHSVVARCQIKTDEACYAVRGERLLFPVGEFETVLTTPEIHYAMKMGHLQSVGEFAYYRRDYLFTDFVDYFFQKRVEYTQAGNPTFNFLCKILMNTLYGKFGQNGRKWTETDRYVWDEEMEGIDDTDGFVRLRQRLGRTQMLIKEGESENSCPIIASEITAYGRMQLWSLIQQAGKENVYYVDTDSLIVSGAGYGNLSGSLDGSKLGAFKVEGTSHNSEFLAPKHYTFGREMKIKGVRKTAEALGGGAYAQEQFRSWDYNLSRGEDGFIDVIPIVKNVSGENTKRVVTGDGWTEPIQLGCE